MFLLRKERKVIPIDIGIVIGTIIGLVVLVIGTVIVNDIIEAQNFTGTIFTVMNNLPVLMGVGGLILAVGWAVLR